MSETDYAVALFRHSGDNKPQQEFWQWEELAIRFTSHTRRPVKEGALWSPTLYRPQTTRAKANVLTVSCLVLDFDRGDELGAVAETGGWHKLAYLAHSTHSHTPARPKWRAVFPLSRPLAAEEWETFYPRARFSLAGDHADPVCRDSSRIYYLPSCPWDADPFVHMNSGAALYVESLLSLDLPEPEPPPVNQETRSASATFRGSGDYRTLDVVAWFTSHGAYGRPLGGEKHAVLCPWENQHTEQRGAEHSDTAVWEARPPYFPAFHCQHAHCDGRRIHDVMALWGDADRFCREPYFEVPPPPEEAPRESERELLAPQETGAENEAGASDAEGFEPEIYTAAQLQHLKLPPVVWAVGGIVPEGVTFLIGHPKSGKSYLHTSMAGAVSLGGVALSSIQVERGKVLMLSMEDGKRRLQERLGMFFEADGAWPDWLSIAHDWEQIGSGSPGLQRLERWLIRNPEARMAILDTWNALRPQHTRNGDLVKEDYNNIRSINRLGKRHGVAILIIHHMSKYLVDDFVNSGSGSHGLSAAAEAILAFQRPRGEHEGKLLVTGKDVLEATYLLRRDERTGFWSLLGQEDQTVCGDTRKAVLEFLVEHGPSNCRQIAAAIGHDERALWQVLQSMERAGEIKKDGRLYRALSTAERFLKS
jgi:hypothetical protein